MTTPSLARRQALGGALGLGIAVDFVGSRAFAASQGAAGDARSWWSSCASGGLDGLTLSPPVGDAELRWSFAARSRWRGSASPTAR